MAKQPGTARFAESPRSSTPPRRSGRDAIRRPATRCGSMARLVRRLRDRRRARRQLASRGRGCKHEPPPGAATPRRCRSGAPPEPSASRRAPAPSTRARSAASSPDPYKPYDGPLMGSMVSQAPIYVGMEAWRDKRDRLHPSRRQGAGRSDADQVGQLRGGLVPPARRQGTCAASSRRSTSTTRKSASARRRRTSTTSSPTLRVEHDERNATLQVGPVSRRHDAHEPYLKAKKKAETEAEAACSKIRPAARTADRSSTKEAMVAAEPVPDGGKPEIG